MRASLPLPLSALTGATFGDHGRSDQAYRYSLFRCWNEALPALAFCMLNPSTADHIKNDPTVERCERRARMLGYGKLIVVNIFALRSTDPQNLYSHPNPTGGPRNDAAIAEAAREADYLVCGWGEHGSFMERGKVVRFLLREQFGVAEKLRHLGLNASGEPKHPLYIGYAVKLQRFPA